ncbi:hypothetical protein SAMN00768000_0296 [Sulfobacillus thermosulfidooxidans DSM 9293]|uniref:Uncharacterized protein n=1 Tax=Sulfobacillus thermosulfidooxidans (strain DSM 9293 / VKM B-1269 / AT-1) TaxID=929705 RepID=A0A1W1W743_SULTA|nr:hypothetical protein [Sulfobacillus thermosulfidooxidans]SMC02085.1 hypothetical protein SAMN00768000_0296 [Sulfobacillus thermosulfidooxidans DSM 9293]
MPGASLSRAHAGAARDPGHYVGTVRNAAPGLRRGTTSHADGIGYSVHTGYDVTQSGDLLMGQLKAAASKPVDAEWVPPHLLRKTLWEATACLQFDAYLRTWQPSAAHTTIQAGNDAARRFSVGNDPVTASDSHVFPILCQAK